MGLINSLWKRRRLLRNLLYWTCGPFAVVYLGGNIVLNSSWAKRKVAEKLEVRIGGAWEIDTLHCGLNGSLNVHDLHGDLGRGFVNVEHIVFSPNWSLIKDKRLGFKSIEVRNPVADLSEEWLRGLVGKVAQPSAPADTQLAQNETTPSDTVLDEQPAESVISSDSGVIPLGVADKSEPQGSAIGVRPSGGAEPKKQIEVFEHDAWLNVSGGELRVRGKSGNVLVELAGVNADVPYGGQDLEGKVACALFRTKGANVLQDASFIIQKKGPNILLKETDLHVLGLQLRPALRVARGIDRRFYFLADLQAKPQNAELTIHRNDFAVSTGVENFQMRIRGGGRIDKPLTWIGEAFLQTGVVRVKESHRESEVFFEGAQSLARLQRGVLHVPGFELRGEDISIMANGALLMDARGFGVVRLVTSPEKKGWIDKLTQGSRVFQNVRGSIMSPLDTVDRFYLDLEFDGTVFEPAMRVNGKTDWQPVWATLEQLSSFVKEERLEEQLLE